MEPTKFWVIAVSVFQVGIGFLAGFYVKTLHYREKNGEPVDSSIFGDLR